MISLANYYNMVTKGSNRVSALEAKLRSFYESHTISSKEYSLLSGVRAIATQKGYSYSNKVQMIGQYLSNKELNRKDITSIDGMLNDLSTYVSTSRAKDKEKFTIKLNELKSKYTTLYSTVNSKPVSENSQEQTPRIAPITYSLPITPHKTEQRKTRPKPVGFFRRTAAALAIGASLLGLNSSGYSEREKPKTEVQKQTNQYTPLAERPISAEEFSDGISIPYSAIVEQEDANRAANTPAIEVRSKVKVPQYLARPKTITTEKPRSKEKLTSIRKNPDFDKEFLQSSSKYGFLNWIEENIDDYRYYSIQQGSRDSVVSLEKAVNSAHSALDHGYDVVTLSYGSDRTKALRKNDFKPFKLLGEVIKTVHDARLLENSAGLVYSIADDLTLRKVIHSKENDTDQLPPITRQVTYAGQIITGSTRSAVSIVNVPTLGLADNVVGPAFMGAADLADTGKHLAQAGTNLIRIPTNMIITDEVNKRKANKVIDGFNMASQLGANVFSGRGMQNADNMRKAIDEKGTIGATLETGFSLAGLAIGIDQATSSNTTNSNVKGGETEGPGGGNVIGGEGTGTGGL